MRNNLRTCFVGWGLCFVTDRKESSNMEIQIWSVSCHMPSQRLQCLMGKLTEALTCTVSIGLYLYCIYRIVPAVLDKGMNEKVYRCFHNEVVGECKFEAEWTCRPSWALNVDYCTFYCCSKSCFYQMISGVLFLFYYLYHSPSTVLA